MTRVEASFEAEFGEDSLLAEYFAGKRGGTYVEVGAYDGVTGSATYYFEQIGWRGVLVEADPSLAARCRSTRRNALVFGCAAVAPGSPPSVMFEIVDGCRPLSSLAVRPGLLRQVEHIADQISIRRISVPAKTLDEILDESGLGGIDFVTIDVEGHEWSVLRGFTLSRWKPSVVILERSSHLPDRRIMRHMHRNGYAYQRTTGVNDWFVLARAGYSAAAVYRARLLLRLYGPACLTLFVPPLRRLARLVRASTRRHGGGGYST